MNSYGNLMVKNAERPNLLLRHSIDVRRSLFISSDRGATFSLSSRSSAVGWDPASLHGALVAFQGHLPADHLRSL